MRPTGFFLLLFSFSSFSCAKNGPSRVLATQNNETCEDGEAQPEFTYEELFKLTTNFWDQFLVPNNNYQTGNSTLFSEDVIGRVDATRYFLGRELNTEYVFDLFAQRSKGEGDSVLGYPIAYNVTKFAANGNVASVSALVTFNIVTFDVLAPVMVETWMTFDKDGKISQYDSTFKWLDFLLDKLMLRASTLQNTSLANAASNIQQKLARSICSTHERSCNGTNQQYPSWDDCFSTLTKKIPFGKSYEMGRNTLLCRSVHENMVPWRPDLHCSHIGPGGGDQCVDDTTYVQKVTEDHYSLSPFVWGGKSHQAGSPVGFTLGF